MHNHNKGGGGHGMMWMMIPCLLLVGFLVFGGGTFLGSGYLWPILFGIFMVAHIWVMFRGHGNHDEIVPGDKVDDALAKNEASKDHTHGSSHH